MRLEVAEERTDCDDGLALMLAATEPDADELTAALEAADGKPARQRGRRRV